MRADKRTPPTPTARIGAQSGFTLLELVVTIGIAALLATIAVPSFNYTIAAERAKSTGWELYTAMVAARSDAIRLDQQVTVQPNGTWAQGWTTLYSGGTLTVKGAIPSASITGPATVLYDPSGRLPLGAAPMFVITATSGNSSSTQCVSINPAGSPYMTEASTC